MKSNPHTRPLHIFNDASVLFTYIVKHRINLFRIGSPLRRFPHHVFRTNFCNFKRDNFPAYKRKAGESPHTSFFPIWVKFCTCSCPLSLRNQIKFNLTLRISNTWLLFLATPCSLNMFYCMVYYCNQKITLFTQFSRNTCSIQPKHFIRSSAMGSSWSQERRPPPKTNFVFFSGVDFNLVQQYQWMHHEQTADSNNQGAATCVPPPTQHKLITDFVGLFIPAASH